RHRGRMTRPQSPAVSPLQQSRLHPSSSEWYCSSVPRRRLGIMTGEIEMLDISDIIAYENGEMNHDQMVDFFQQGISEGWVWTLQGHYGRTAQALIDAGECFA